MLNEKLHTKVWTEVKKMRLVLLNLLILLGGVLIAQVNAGDFGNIKFGDMSGVSDFETDMKSLFQTHINLSLKYLYTGVGYQSQKVERPGIGKKLKELSDLHWQEGIDLLKKHFQRGGTVKPFHSTNIFKFDAKNELASSVKASTDLKKAYLVTLLDLVRDSRDCTSRLNRLHKSTVFSTTNHDADWGHYVEEKLEKEESRKRQFMGLYQDLEKMGSSSLAVHLFDSHL